MSDSGWGGEHLGAAKAELADGDSAQEHRLRMVCTRNGEVRVGRVPGARIARSVALKTGQHSSAVRGAVGLT